MSLHGQIAPGTILSGVYRIIRPLSEGGMGAVFVAEHVNTRKQRALKTMHGDLLGDPQLRERFVQEAQIGGRIDSEHVVEVVDAGFDEQLRVPWLAMELLEGESLADKLERGPVTPTEVQEILQQLCHALAAAHRVGIVHRDLKPENIFVSRARRVGSTFTVKVLDFGIAKVVAEAKATRMATAAIGTPLWMAPEQTEMSNRVGPPTDVWALGLIAFRMLTGRYYWLEAYRDAQNVTAVLTEMLMKPIVAASQRAAELGAGHLLPPGFDAWFAACVDREPGRRYRDAGQAYEALAPLLRGGAQPQAPQPTAMPGQGATQLGWGSGGYAVPQIGQQASGTMVYGQGGATPAPPLLSPAHGMPAVQAGTPQHVSAAPLMSPAFGVPAPQTPPHLVAQGTPPGVAMGTGGRSKPRRSGAASFAIGLGSVLVLGIVAVVVIKVVNSDNKTEPKTGNDTHEKKGPPKPENKWVRIEPKKNVVLGLDSDSLSPTLRGFRPSRKITAPSAPYEIQQHEVTWGEIDSFLANEKGFKPPKDVPGDEKKRDKLPATGIPWSTAVAYCKSLGGNLPTEEQWEFAARGKEKRKFAWGSEGIDVHRTRVFAGEKATLMPVMTMEQDKTPDDIYDLMGNAQEWTLDAYRDDFPDQDEGWGSSFRVVRGLPIAESIEGSLSSFTAAYRVPVCATGACAPPSKGSAGDPVLLLRAAFSNDPPPAGGPARPFLVKTLTDMKSDLGTCLDKASDPDGYLLKIDFKLPLKPFPVCRASDNYDDPMECCTGKVCPHAPHRLIKYDPVKLSVSNPTDPEVPGSTGPAGTCAKSAVEKKLAGVKWPEAADDWSATVWVHRQEAKPPKSVAYIGFRCAKPASKE